MAAHPYNSEFDGRSQTEHGGIPNSLGVIRIIWIDGPAGRMNILKHRLNHPSRQYRFPRAHLGEKAFGVKHVLGWILHGSLLWLHQFHLARRDAKGQSLHFVLVARLRQADGSLKGLLYRTQKNLHRSEGPKTMPGSSRVIDWRACQNDRCWHFSDMERCPT
jgi:hypothetical protein